MLEFMAEGRKGSHRRLRDVPTVMVSGLVFWTALTLVATPVSAKPTKTKQSVLVIPFGISTVDHAKTAAQLTEATRDFFSQVKTRSVEIAQAPLIDILTLVECEAITDPCIGELADTLDADVVVVGKVSRKKGKTVVEIAISSKKKSSRNKKSLVRHRIRLGLKQSASKDANPLVRHLREAMARSQQSNQPEKEKESQSESRSRRTKRVTTAPNISNSIEPTPEPTPSVKLNDDAESAQQGTVQPVTWLTLAIGVVALGTGVVFYRKSKSTEDEIAMAPTNTPAELERLQGLERTGDTQLTTGTTLLVVGSVATIAGIGLLFWDLRRSKTTERSIVIAPAVNPQGLSVTLQGSF